MVTGRALVVTAEIQHTALFYLKIYAPNKAQTGSTFSENKMFFKAVRSD